MRRGFTLIELLVVIAIIALLMGVLLPSLRRARESGRTVVCQTHLKQWGLCYEMYMQENNNRFAVGYDASRGWDSYFLWMDRMRPFFQDDVIFTCPAARKDSQTPHGNSGQRWGSTLERWHAENSIIKSDYQGSYGQNYWVCAAPNSGQWPKARHWVNTSNSQVPKAYIPLFLDCVWIGGYPDDTDRPMSAEEGNSQGGSQMNRYAMNRHTQGVNCVFLDQSARKVRVKELWSLKWHTQFDTHNMWTQSEADWPEWIK